MYMLAAMIALLSGGSLDLTSIKSAMSTTFGEVKTGVIDMVSASVPYALAIIGTVLAVTIGIKVFKKLTSQA